MFIYRGEKIKIYSPIILVIQQAVHMTMRNRVYETGEKINAYKKRKAFPSEIRKFVHVKRQLFQDRHHHGFSVCSSSGQLQILPCYCVCSTEFITTNILSLTIVFYLLPYYFTDVSVNYTARFKARILKTTVHCIWILSKECLFTAGNVLSTNVLSGNVAFV